MNLKITFPTLAVILTVSVACIFGCSEDSKLTDDNLPTSVPNVVRTTPNEGSTDAPLKPVIGFKFDMPMDTASFMRNFHFTGDSGLPNWMDSLQHHRGMMGGGMMNMGHMMNWLDSIDFHGEFDWNQELDSCTFYADSTLMPNTSCMLYVYGDVRGRNNMMMNMNGYQYGGYMVHFRTKP